MEFVLITTGVEIRPKDIIREPIEKRLFEILDIDPTFNRLLLQYYTIDHIADADRKILVHQEAILNRWEKLT